MYVFKIKAKNGDNIETAWSAPAHVLTKPKKSDLYPEQPIYSLTDKLMTAKTIRLPLKISNHPTAGSQLNPWKLSWVVSMDNEIGNQDDTILDTWSMTDSFIPGQTRRYTFEPNPSQIDIIKNHHYYGVTIKAKARPQKAEKIKKPKKTFISKLKEFLPIDSNSKSPPSPPAKNQ